MSILSPFSLSTCVLCYSCYSIKPRPPLHHCIRTTLLPHHLSKILHYRIWPFPCCEVTTLIILTLQHNRPHCWLPCLGQAEELLWKLDTAELHVRNIPVQPCPELLVAVQTFAEMLVREQTRAGEWLSRCGAERDSLVYTLACMWTCC